MCLSPGKKGLAHAKILFLRRNIRTPERAYTVPGKMQNCVKVKLTKRGRTNRTKVFRSSIPFRSNTTFCSDSTFRSDATFRSNVGIFCFYSIFFLPKKKAFHVKGEKLHSLLSLKSFFIPTLRAQNPVDLMALF